MDGEGLPAGVLRVRELRAVRGPRDFAVHDSRLVREVALMLAIAVDEPDVEALVPAAIPQEGDLLRVGRPPRPDRPLARPGQLEDALAVKGRAEDLERSRAVPRERDLGAVGRKIDPAPDVIDVGHARELLDREAAIAVSDGTRRHHRWRRLDV